MAALCKDNGEDSMGPAAGLVHVGGSHSPRRSAGERVNGSQFSHSSP